ncbi:MAG: HAMP domain-containing protein [Gammaproteobacteria bacterium]|nr:MAG: HAMP domain-containing protein [Gammaproteobacteria bacterium]
MNESNRQRRHYFIDRGFQGRFIAWMVGLILLSGLLSGLLLYLLLGSDMASQGHSLHLSLEKVLAGLGLTIVLGNMLVTALVGGIAAWMVLHLSHRIAGPLYRLRRLIDEIAKGNYTIDATLRDSDQLKELADDFERMAAALGEREERYRSLLEACRRQLRGASDADAREQLLKALDEVLQEPR